MIVWTVWLLDCGELAYHPDRVVSPPNVLAVYGAPEDAAEACAMWCADQQPCEVREMVLVQAMPDEDTTVEDPEMPPLPDGCPICGATEPHDHEVIE